MHKGLRKELSAFSVASQPTSFSGGVRTIISKQKRRFVDEGFDLDLSYITPHIIAMGYPSSGVEGMYRNPRDEVRRFLSQRHGGHYKVYNLCSERSYTKEDSQFEEVGIFPFDDHNPCALQMIESLCESVNEFLSRHFENVVAIHCKAGKGRTGLAIVCYLLYAGICVTTESAIAYYAERRTSNRKGITIPSQIRYVYYFERLLRTDEELMNSTFQISHIRINTVPKWRSKVTGGGCHPFLRIKTMVQSTNENHKWKVKTIFDQRKVFGKELKQLKRYYISDDRIDIPLLEYDIKVRGDVNFCLFDRSLASDENICQVWFHTAFVEKNFLVFKKSVIDRARNDRKNKYFDENFSIEIYLHRVEDKDSIDGVNDISDNKSQVSEVDVDDNESSVDLNGWENRSVLQMSEVPDVQETNGELSPACIELDSDLNYSDGGSCGSSVASCLKSDLIDMPSSNAVWDALHKPDNEGKVLTENKELHAVAKKNLLLRSSKRNPNLHMFIPQQKDGSEAYLNVGGGSELADHQNISRPPKPAVTPDLSSSNMFATARNMLLQSSPRSGSSQPGTENLIQNVFHERRFTSPAVESNTDNYVKCLPLNSESLRKINMLSTSSLNQKSPMAGSPRPNAFKAPPKPWSRDIDSDTEVHCVQPMSETYSEWNSFDSLHFRHSKENDSPRSKSTEKSPKTQSGTYSSYFESVREFKPELQQQLSSSNAETIIQYKTI